MRCCPQSRKSFVHRATHLRSSPCGQNVLEQGQACGLYRIERFMREQALNARPRRGQPKDRNVRRVVANNVLAHQGLLNAGEQTSCLVVDTLVVVVWWRGMTVALLHHSDKGCPVHQRALPEASKRAGHHLQREQYR